MSNRLGEHTIKDKPNWIAYLDSDSMEFIGVNDTDKTTALGSSYQELLDNIADIDKAMVQYKLQFKAFSTKRDREDKIASLKQQLADLEQEDSVNYYGGPNC